MPPLGFEPRPQPPQGRILSKLYYGGSRYFRRVKVLFICLVWVFEIFLNVNSTSFMSGKTKFRSMAPKKVEVVRKFSVGSAFKNWFMAGATMLVMLGGTQACDSNNSSDDGKQILTTQVIYSINDTTDASATIQYYTKTIDGQESDFPVYIKQEFVSGTDQDTTHITPTRIGKYKVRLFDLTDHPLTTDDYSLYIDDVECYNLYFMSEISDQPALIDYDSSMGTSVIVEPNTGISDYNVAITGYTRESDVCTYKELRAEIYQGSNLLGEGISCDGKPFEVNGSEISLRPMFSSVYEDGNSYVGVWVIDPKKTYTLENISVCDRTLSLNYVDVIYPRGLEQSVWPLINQFHAEPAEIKVGNNTYVIDSVATVNLNENGEIQYFEIEFEGFEEKK